jgi:hypothetical protein
MILTEENLQEWKQKLDIELLIQYKITDYSQQYSDEWLLEEFLGNDIEEAIEIVEILEAIKKAQ